MSDIKTIGVLTSGGDAPGMNAAIRSVVRFGINSGLAVKGIKKGYAGLIKGDIIDLNARSVSDILHRGGTILQTARCDEFKTKEGVMRGVNMANVFGIEGLIVIGGDGSFRGARDLSNAGLPTIGIPATIDNDIGCTEYCIGFDTALNTVKDAIDKIRDTSTSHERSSVVEVMGRDAGYIALNVGISCGAEVVIIPEHEHSFEEDVLRPIMEAKNRGKNHYMIIVAEGVGGSVEIAQKIEDFTGIEARATVIGYIQRGGSPTVRDRLIASEMGGFGVELLLKGKSNRLVVVKDNKVSDIDITEGLETKKSIEAELIRLSKILAM